MSVAVFADTFHFLALLNSSDPAHVRAIEASCVPGREFVTTEFVLLELADALAYPRDRVEFFVVRDAITNDPSFHIVPASTELLARGIQFYRERPDKEWSLTDCISFVVMAEKELSEALTGDRHFEQAGFKPLLK
jgi:predicted nucleic acid-binding protein